MTSTAPRTIPPRGRIDPAWPPLDDELLLLALRDLARGNPIPQEDVVYSSKRRMNG
ncbi:hypothetical protein ACWDZ4_20225 [Streptomyces sp. NPDC003016]